MFRYCIVDDPLCGGIFGICQVCREEIRHRRRVEEVRASRLYRDPTYGVASENLGALFGSLFGAVAGAVVGSAVHEHRKEAKKKAAKESGRREGKKK
jgi:hypothetical protein